MATVMASSRRTSAEHRFFTGMALAILATVIVGFAPSFFLRPLFPGWPSPPETIFYVHGAVFTAWVVLFVVQTSLVAGGRTGLHRKIGPSSAVLAAAMVVLGTLGALIAARRPTGFLGISVPPLQFLATPLFDIALFAAFTWLAIARRQNPQTHKRWMLLATVNLVTAAIAPWPGVGPFGPVAFFALTDVFVLPLAIWDFRTRGRLHPVTLWGGLLIIVSQPLRLVVSNTEGWLVFARWATGLLG
ncbi:MAG TPA: hypothetical protein VNL98_07285 [Gemmatimonadales bacterium]|nr:hypothetical protein [Gemmatimonadales bacterium]